MPGGIYRIVNTFNNKVYIGSSQDISKRQNSHFEALRSNRHPNHHLQAAYNKYGENVFKFEVIEFVDQIDRLIEREQWWIDNTTEILYNISPTAGSTLGYSHTIETKQKISVRAQGHKRCVGRVLSNETKQKIAASNKGYKKWQGRKHSIETKQKLRESKMGKQRPLEAIEKTASQLRGRKQNPIHVEQRARACQKPVAQINIDTNEIIQIWESAKIAAQTLGINYGCIGQVCLGKRNSAGKYKWAFYAA